MAGISACAKEMMSGRFHCFCWQVFFRQKMIEIVRCYFCCCCFY